jgi:hypothetical protein
MLMPLLGKSFNTDCMVVISLQNVIPFSLKCDYIFKHLIGSFFAPVGIWG